MLQRPAPCPLCDKMSELGVSGGDYHRYACPQCGKFEITGSAEACERSPELRLKLGGWIRDENRHGRIPRIFSKTLGRIALQAIPGVAERVERFLLEAVSGLERLSDLIDVTDPRFIAATYSWDSEDTAVLRELATARGWIRFREVGARALVTAEGYIAADALAVERGGSEEVFVAMSFAPDMVPIYDEGLRVGIELAGYVPIRLDRTEHVNRIDDEILARIRRSAFVVADFTQHKSGVYFEAGFALGLNLPVIWSCRQDDLDNLHLDIRQYNCIDWEDPDELARRLRLRIEAIIGKVRDWYSASDSTLDSILAILPGPREKRASVYKYGTVFT